jgi:hypothetical protein
MLKLQNSIVFLKILTDEQAKMKESALIILCEKHFQPEFDIDGFMPQAASRSVAVLS